MHRPAASPARPRSSGGVAGSRSARTARMTGGGGHGTRDGWIRRENGGPAGRHVPRASGSRLRAGGAPCASGPAAERRPAEQSKAALGWTDRPLRSADHPSSGALASGPRARGMPPHGSAAARARGPGCGPGTAHVRALHVHRYIRPVPRCVTPAFVSQRSLGVSSERSSVALSKDRD